MTTPRSPLHASLAWALAGDLRTLVGRLKRRLREETGHKDLTPSQVSVLLRLEQDGPSTLSQLARAEGMRPQSMGAVVAALEQAELIHGTPDPHDGRKIQLSLTDACRTWVGEGRAARQDWLCRAIEAKLTDPEQEQLAAAISLLKRLAED